MEQPDKVGYVIESCTTNGGIRSVIAGDYAPGAMAPTHFHTKFNETFEVVEGELAVWKNKEKVILTNGKKVIIERGVLHSFKNISKNSVKLRLTIEPGFEGFEQNIHILKGLQQSGKIKQFSKITPQIIPYGIVLSELTDTNLVGLPGLMLKISAFFIGKKKLYELRKILLEQYGST